MSGDSEGPARTCNDSDYDRGVGIPMKPSDNFKKEMMPAALALAHMPDPTDDCQLQPEENS